MSASWNKGFIEALHASPGRLVLVVTGGGSQAISALLEVPGASRTVLEAAVPYADEALVRWLGATPEQFCSEETARLMAMSAYRRALDDAGAEAGSALAGIACTASLASDQPKHGPHRIHLALQTSALTLSHSLTLAKGRRSRFEEETVAAALALNLVAEFKGREPRLEAGLLAEESLLVQRCDAPPEWQQLLSGERQRVPANRGARPRSPGRRLIFSGAYHPRHDGHREMARLAAARVGLPVEHELSIVNVDKPPIDFIEMQKRAAQFGDDEPLWLTRAATFVEKAVLFPAATFVVGVDTLARIAQAKYYGGTSVRDAVLAAFAASGVRFLVFGRHYDGSFRSLAALELPPVLAQLCDEVPAAEYCMDVSSTGLRRDPSLK
ncbi:MAG TPA: CinA family protein [Pirellulales bacterium]|nr:CinA family protein [Pirellulales bacterium]